MDEKFLQQLFAELIESQQEALAILTQSIARQLDPGRLEQDLLGHLKAAELVGPTPGLLRRFVESCAAAAKAETWARQASDPAAKPRPN